MSYIFSKQLDKYFEKAYNADTATREKAREHWGKAARERKNELDFDGVIFATEHINAIDAAGTIIKYIENALAFFYIDTEHSLYTFDYFDAPPENFADYRSAAAFAKYNLNEMEKAGAGNADR